MNEFLFENEEVINRNPPPLKKKLDTPPPTAPVEKELIVRPIDSEPVECGCQDQAIETPVRVETYVGMEVDSKVDDLYSVIASMEGSPWVVQYFQQYLAQDDEPSGFSIDRIAAYQQYRLIKNLEIRVQSPLSYSYDGEFSVGELTGDARLFPLFKPNIGDMMIADIGDGRSALIEIENVRKLSHRKNSAWGIEYHVVEFLTEEVHRAIMAKVVDTYLFSYDRLLSGESALMEEGVFNTLGEIEQRYDRLANIYIKHFLDEETMSFSVPVGTGVRVYDIEQSKFINNTIDKGRYPEYRKMRIQRIDTAKKNKIVSIWDALYNLDWLLMDEARNTFSLIRPNFFEGPRRLFNAYYGLYDLFIYGGHEVNDPQSLSYSPRFTAPAELPLFIDEDTSTNRRYIYQVGLENSYVFSKYFYIRDVAHMSRLEKQVFHLLNKRPLCPAEILRLMDASIRWDDLDRYYYIPILLFMAKLIIQGYQVEG